MSKIEDLQKFAEAERRHAAFYLRLAASLINDGLAQKAYIDLEKIRVAWNVFERFAIAGGGMSDELAK